MPGKGRKKRGRSRNGAGAIWQVGPNRWRGQIYLGKDGDGKPIRRSVSGSSADEVADQIDALKQDHRNGIDIKPSKLTVGQHFESWLREKERSKQRNTMSKYRNHFKNHIKPMLGDDIIVDVDFNRINWFFDLLANKKKPDGRPALSPTTQTDIARVLSMGLNDAVRKGVIRSNPVHQVEGPQPEDKEARWMPPDEWRAFIFAAVGERLEDFYWLGFHTGLRPSELLGLPKENIDLRGRKLRVAQALHEDGNVIWIGKLKSPTSYRTISLGDGAVAAIEQQLAQLAEDKREAGVTWKVPTVERGFSPNLLFPGVNGGWIRRSTIYKHDLGRVLSRGALALISQRHDLDVKETWEKNRELTRPGALSMGTEVILPSGEIYRAEIGDLFDGVGLHALRHTHAAVLINQGANPLQIRDRLGHKDVAFTLQTYGHLFPRDDEKVATFTDAFVQTLGRVA